MTPTSPEARNSHDSDPTAPRRAATVVLVRDGALGVEAWMMRRVSGMAFAAGAAVFPGGRVDPSDDDDTTPWEGQTPAALAAQLLTSPPEARQLAQAAIRELFEESGVLLASLRPDQDPSDLRGLVESRALGFAAALKSLGATLRVDLLHPWARWVTPAVEARRYDTWFFLAMLPSGQEPASVSTEADHAEWLNAAEVIESQRRGEALVLPPTLAILYALKAAGTVEKLMSDARHRNLEPVHPQVEIDADGSARVIADGITYEVSTTPVSR